MIAFRQWIPAAPNGSSASVTTPAITTVSGSLLVAMVFCETNKIGASPLSDSKSNTWSSAVAAFGSATFAAMFYVENCTGGASHTFTFTPTSSDFISMLVLEITGAATSGSLNGTSTSTTNTASHNSGNITAGSSVPELWVGGWNPATSAAMVTVTVDPTWCWGKIQVGATIEGEFFGMRPADPSTVGAFSLSASTSAASPIMVAGFKSATAAPSGGGGSYVWAG